MGSGSDWETMRPATEILDRLGVAHEVRVVSAHRTPDLLFEYASSAQQRGLEVIIAGAGGAAHLPGMTASKTTLPVLGVPVQSKALNGMDSLLSIVQMPAGVPVATFAIGGSGATNAALFAASILALRHARHRRGAEEVSRITDARRARITGSAPRTLAMTSRHHRGRPARPHAGPGGLSARSRLPLSRPLAGNAGRTGRADPGRLVRRTRRSSSSSRSTSMSSRSTGRTSPSRDSARSLRARSVWPPPAALATSQDRLLEKQLFRKLRIPTTRLAAVDSREDLLRAGEEIGVPGVLKTRRGGYDGKGQIVVRKRAELAAAWAQLAGQPLIYEQFVTVRLARCPSSARAADAARSQFYPLNANVHADGILSLTSRAVRARRARSARRRRYLRRVLRHFRYVGILTIEFFVAARQAHRQRDGAARAQLGALDHRGRGHQPVRESPARDPGLPLGSTAAVGHSPWSTSSAACRRASSGSRMADLHLHDYGKEPAAGPQARSLHARRATAARRDALLRQALKKLP